jgi:hypothetical protein
MYGLLQGALRPPEQSNMLRSSRCQRRMVIEMASRAVRPRKKAFAQLHLKLTEVVSYITRQPGRGRLRASGADTYAPHACHG